jgi:hypothetical protein
LAGILNTLEVFMNLKMISGLIVAAGLMMGCGTTTPAPESQASKPISTRAQSYNATFAQKYVDALLLTYGITRTTFGLEQTRATAINSLINGQTTPSALRDNLLNPLVGLNFWWGSSNESLGSPENFVNFVFQNYLLSNVDDYTRSYWASRLRTGTTPSQVRDAFIDSAYYIQNFPNERFVASVYSQVLRRAASPGEIQDGSRYLSQGVVTRSNFIRIALDTAEFANCQFINMVTVFEPIWTRAAGFIYPGPLGPPSRCN